GMPRGA
nr:Chain C, GLY-MET-PRO-ARG-GLY-ALA [Spbetavirus SPbeta]5Y24_D Chain D, GLY-MET-PRO-ARG-GLY-ALA [Spbetavirus SPbeta]5ZW6_C Chain C, GLY-MET-PRO-ARG-GLY-ALA [synthetic construct]5ZW6_D Chain D, GLY-MET-PRO-ARG-GLY-ALA [synthetic construct]6HP5_C Chain C, GLY-MET-PRO-ARG-GLY-ALA [Bacillus subtilis subsp. subtilis str. 168]6HP5_D Chain D, GLY-MET-PRO-ARG-GLY-ALA [Bacillus subtilis subsp. subtilis str. 168]6IM4_C Chain C, GLY-MET-PRO-ARG-GLY-ALA [synthetic construct]6IM4_D Chain D, GLY-MET-PRO-A